jgi:hypothetical protein
MDVIQNTVMEKNEGHSLRVVRVSEENRTGQVENEVFYLLCSELENTSPYFVEILRNKYSRHCYNISPMLKEHETVYPARKGPTVSSLR